jgi:hypothetical protein
MLPTKVAVRLAVRLAAAWAEHARRPDDDRPAWTTAFERFERVKFARHRLGLAKLHGLLLSLAPLRAALDDELGELVRRLAQLRLKTAERAVEIPSLAELYADVRQLEDEFGDVRIDWRQRTFCVVTEAIVLRGIDLGRFRLKLHWTRVGLVPAERCFEVDALDPNPAAGKDDIFHPHVRDAVFCSGDAADAFDRAVFTGRLADAFVIVRSVLTTYNGGSAYATLEEWTGTPCADCGRVVDGDDRQVCDGCGSELCLDCSGSCEGCSNYFCNDCIRTCLGCESVQCRRCLLASPHSKRFVCHDCAKSCARCRRLFAPSEISRDRNFCPPCDAAEPAERTDLAPALEPENSSHAT